MTEIDPLSSVNCDAMPNLDRAGRELVHDIATPLATLQLNLQVLITYLPVLLQCYKNSPDATKLISPEHMQALATLPGALDADIRKIRLATQQFSAVLVPPKSVPSTLGRTVQSSKSIQNILLVEDETIHQEITLKQLGSGYVVDIAASGKAALELVGKPYDLILLDLVLPGVDSDGLIKVLRERCPATPIVVVSNMPLSSDELQKLSVDGVLEKPFRYEKFQALLATFS